MWKGLLALIVTGCVVRPPAGPAMLPVRCTTSYTLPVVHTVVASVAAAATVALAVRRPDAGDCGGMCPLVFALGIATPPVVAVFDGIYAADAWMSVRQCRRVQAAVHSE